MVSEKIEASLALQGKALSGGLGTTARSAAAKTLDHYRQKVRANKTRLANGATRRPYQPKQSSVTRYLRYFKEKKTLTSLRRRPPRQQHRESPWGPRR
jgi:hypothetical protein